MPAKYYLLMSILISTNTFAIDEEPPSLDFLEYLGEQETEIDGELIGPTEFELIVDSTAGEANDHE